MTSETIATRPARSALVDALAAVLPGITSHPRYDAEAIAAAVYRDPSSAEAWQTLADALAAAVSDANPLPPIAGSWATLAAPPELPDDTVWVCARCGSDFIACVTSVPRSQGTGALIGSSPNVTDPAWDSGHDEAYWEAESVDGWECRDCGAEHDTLAGLITWRPS